MDPKLDSIRDEDIDTRHAGAAPGPRTSRDTDAEDADADETDSDLVDTEDADADDADADDADEDDTRDLR